MDRFVHTGFLRLGCALAITLAATATAHSEQARARRVATASKVEEAPLIDGTVDDSVWETAEVLTGFIQAEPFQGQGASEKTEVRILYDDTNIYVGAILHDSDPGQIIATDARRDAELDETDSFRIIFDTYRDRQNGFVFGTNPSGLEHDGQVSNEGQGGGGGGIGRRNQSGSGSGYNLNWDTSFRVATQRGDYGWSAEFAIPLRTLRYSPSRPQSWGLNFQRNIRRKREVLYWSPVERVFNLYRLSQAGDLEGLELAAPRNFKVTPYALGQTDRDYSTQEEFDGRGDIGVDAKFGITQAMNLDLTYNTDFAQVEVDDQQINLTRFSLFFPEKRPFFLENAGYFQLGAPQSVDLFFSRRIGIGPAGEIVPIVGGGRVSGKAGRYNVGFLNMQTESVQSLNTSANNYTVGSVSREIGSRSKVGAMFVNRLGTGAEAGDSNWNRTYGVNGTLGVGQNITVTGFAAGTDTGAGSPNADNLVEGESEYSYRGRAEYSQKGGRIWLGFTEVAENFNPEVGFLRRQREYRNLDTGWFLNLRNDISWLRELRPHVTYRGFWSFDGFKQTENIHIDSHVDFENGGFFSPAFNRTVEGLDQPFEISDGIVVQPGTYQNW